VRITTSHPSKPVIEIPVEVLQRHQATRRPVQVVQPSQPVRPGSEPDGQPMGGG
jgi:hypothetical protein